MNRWLRSLITVAALIGCSAPKVRLSSTPLPSKAALFPVVAPGAMRAERKSYLQEILRSSLQSRGYVLLNETASSCVTAECRAQLGQNYNVPAVFELKIDSVSKNNFIVGFADQIQGRLELTDLEGKVLFTASHMESSAGGLLLESGLAIQGIKSQIENYGDNGFRKLARRFVDRIAAQLPGPTGSTESVDHLELKDLTATRRNGAFFEVCANGTPKLFAALKTNQSYATMREVATGRYCGVFPLDDGPASVELKTAFGTAVSKELQLAKDQGCDSSVTARLFPSTWRISLSKPCRPAIVYRAPTPIGPYVKVGEIQHGDWQDRRPLKEAFYQIVFLSSLGETTPPISPEIVVQQ